MNSETIFIVGFGAIGKALAVFLTTMGKKVIIIRGSVHDGRAADHSLKVAQQDGITMEQNVPVTTLTSIDKIDGLIILATKSFGNENLSKALKNKADNTPIVILQNGMNVEAPFLDDGFNHIYRCVLFATAQMMEDETVRFRPVAASPIGVIKGDLSTLNNLVKQIDSPHFHFKTEEDIQPFIWKKTIINTVFNSICPLLNTDNGIFYREPMALNIAKRIIKAGVAIARENGIELLPDDIERNLLNISKSSEGQLISTLQDINHRRNTEINSLNFELLRIAEIEGIADMAKEIRLLGELIKIKEKINQ